MKIIAISALKDNYIWLLIDEAAKDAIAVDPGEAEPLIHYLKEQELGLKALFLTHHHFDHIGGVAEILDYQPNLAVYGPRDARIPYINHVVHDGERISELSCQFSIIAIPGHTSTHICFYEPQHHWLFCGDTLFSAGCGRVFDGSLSELYAALMKLKSLPNETQVYSAHEYTLKNLAFAALVEPSNLAIQNWRKQLAAVSCTLPSTIAREMEINPFFRVLEPGVQDYARSRGSDLDAFAVFTQLRKDKDNF